MAFDDLIPLGERPSLDSATLVLAFTGWMDGGDVSTGTVRRLVDLLQARPFAEVDADPYHIYNVPGPMEVATLFRPHVVIEEGKVSRIDLPSNVFYCQEQARLVLFIGREPNLRWRAFGERIFHVSREVGVRRILFVGSFGGPIPHTREPRLYMTCSAEGLLSEMEQYGLRRTGYAGPGSFTSYLMSQAPSAGLEMVSLVAEIPGYLQGTNPASIEAVTRRLAKILQLPLDLRSLRAASTEWELRVSAAVEEDEDLAGQVRRLEEAYDNELLERAAEQA